MGGAARRGAVTTSGPAELRVLIGSRPAGRAAFIATWSLSEAPLELRRIVLPEVAAFDAFLLGYKDHYEGIDNRSHFAAWRATLPDHAWRELPIPHLRKAEWYLFGIRKGILSSAGGQIYALVAAPIPHRRRVPARCDGLITSG